MNFFEKLKKSVLSLNETSLKIMKYGLQFAVGVSFIGLVAYILNNRARGFNFFCEQLSIYIILAGVSLFVQFIIGGLILDSVQKRRS